MQKKNPILLYTIVISIIFHLVGIYLLSRTAMLPARPSKNQPVNNVIDARLIFTPILTQTTKTIENPPAEELPKPVTTSTMPELQMKPEKQPIPLQANPTEITKGIATDPAPPTSKPPPANVVSPVQNLQKPMTSIARRHLGQFHQQQQHKMAQDAAKNFQELKDSPIIEGKIKDKFLSETEKLMKENQVKIDCSSTTNQVVAGLAGLLGGNRLTCSRGPAIEGFIQKRLNKSMVNNKQHQPRTKQRPQSVVIQP